MNGFAHASAGGVADKLLKRIVAASAGTGAFALAAGAVVEGQWLPIAVIAAGGVLLDVEANSDRTAAGHPHVDF